MRNNIKNSVYLNCIGTAVPPHDVHDRFVQYAPDFLKNDRHKALFARMVDRSGIVHRYSFLPSSGDFSGKEGDIFYVRGRFPSTGLRMAKYKEHAFSLVQATIANLGEDKLRGVTHVIVTSCTGFYAPGIDLDIVRAYGLDPSVERTIIGFMGCHAALNALKYARHIVRSVNTARVLIVNVELCTLHLQETEDLETLLSFLIFADGCAASIVSADPTGLRLDQFSTHFLTETPDLISWHIGDQGFDMVLSGEVPKQIENAIPEILAAIKNVNDIDIWAVHPGGRSILDAVEKGAGLQIADLKASREILRQYGNMSSATIMFVLQNIMNNSAVKGTGCALAFGPGLTVESIIFQK